MANESAGRLYVVATPIGNLADISARAVSVLGSVSLVACEDTRRTGRLLAHLGITPPELVALHDHNERAVADSVLTRLEASEKVALVADAGTPLVSDPGFVLVREAWRRGLDVVPVPGASAVTSAVSISPIPATRFRFEGFLPARAKARDAELNRLLAADSAVVFLESPRRIRATLVAIEAQGGGKRDILLCRELTKLHESTLHGTVSELVASPHRVREQGEFTCVLAPAPSPAPPDSAEDLLDALLTELAPARAARVAARITGRPRSELYALATTLAARASTDR